VVKDLIVGTGAVAESGDNVVVQYVGVNYADGKQFDASWDDGPGGTPQPFPFQLGAGQVIAGWDQGIPGMRVGGRRELIIPPSLAYGSDGQGPIGPNETLVFVVDLLRVG
jgi:peptidylprolyl isomerase